MGYQSYKLSAKRRVVEYRVSYPFIPETRILIGHHKGLYQKVDYVKNFIQDVI